MLTLSTANAYSGTTAINGGTLQLGGSNYLPATHRGDAGEYLRRNAGPNNFNQTIASLSGGGAIGGNIALGTRPRSR